jgi:hypothetical protein
VWVPADAGDGEATISVRMIDWPNQKVMPATVKAPIAD